MVAFDDDFHFVADSVSRAARLQRAACRAVLDDEAARGHALARHLDLAYEAIEMRVEARRTDFDHAPDDLVRKDSVVEMRRLVWDVRKLQSNLAWLDAAQEPALDLGTTYFLEDAARELVARDVEVTVVSTDQLSYATTSDPWEPLIEGWGRGIPQNEPTVVVIFVPRREIRSGLLHPLIVHELGHAADSELGVVDEIWDVAQKRRRFAQRFAKAVTDLASERNLDPQDANDHIVDRLRSWIAEIFCDSVALNHLGPTYLYSFLAEVVAASMDEPGPRHPPPRQRVRILIEQLDRLGWADEMRVGDPALDTWTRQHAAERPSYSSIEGFLSWAVNELRAVIRNRALKLLGSRVFTPEPAQLDEVATLLEQGIPPAQGHDQAAIPREAIMLACWHAALAGVGAGPRALATAPDAPELEATLPAALELSAITEAWRAQ